MAKLPVLAVAAALLSPALARTDISGCVSTATTDQYAEASLLWYVPGTGEICSFVDCGGGTAPPKSDTPGCPLYTGTATVTPSYLPGFGSSSALSAPTASATGPAGKAQDNASGHPSSATSASPSSTITTAPFHASNSTTFSSVAGGKGVSTSPAGGSGSNSGSGSVAVGAAAGSAAAQVAVLAAGVAAAVAMVVL